MELAGVCWRIVRYYVVDHSALFPLFLSRFSYAMLEMLLKIVTFSLINKLLFTICAIILNENNFRQLHIYFQSNCFVQSMFHFFLDSIEVINGMVFVRWLKLVIIESCQISACFNPPTLAPKSYFLLLVYHSINLN